MKKVSVIVSSILVLLLVFSVGFSLTLVPLSQTFPEVPNVKYGGTLTLADQAGQLTNNFNPFFGSGYLAATVYESLFYVTLNGNVTPSLGTSYKWENNNLKLVITTREGVKWSDGVPFTANDVVFTFNLLKEYPALDESGIWSNISGLQSVEASGTNTVVFKFSVPNVPLFTYIAEVLILPEHIWSTVKDPVHFENPNPVGTGPFVFSSFDSALNEYTFVKNPNYWMKGRPFVDKVVGRSFVGGNTPTLLSMLKGETQYTFNFIPDPQKTWVAKDPEYNKIYWPVISSNVLLFNTQEYPFNDPTFRKAIDFAINKAATEKEVYFETGGYNQSQTGIIPQQRGEWMDPTLISLDASLNSYNPERAQVLLKSIGFVKNANGQLTGPDGRVLPTFKIITGEGWTDAITEAAMISSNLKEIGISAMVGQVTPSNYWASLMSGTYDMAISWGFGIGETVGPSPYYYYYQEFNPTFSATKIGETAISDFTRYTNPIITAALKIYQSTNDPYLQKQAMYTIERIILEDLPIIVLNNRTSMVEYSTKDFIGFPSYSDPYCNGETTDTLDTGMVVRNVHLR